MRNCRVFIVHRLRCEEEIYLFVVIVIIELLPSWLLEFSGLLSLMFARINQSSHENLQQSNERN